MMILVVAYFLGPRPVFAKELPTSRSLSDLSRSRNSVIIYIFYSPKTAANSRAIEEKSLACGNFNHSWFRVLGLYLELYQVE